MDINTRTRKEDMLNSNQAVVKMGELGGGKNEKTGVKNKSNKWKPVRNMVSVNPTI